MGTVTGEGTSQFPSLLESLPRPRRSYHTKGGGLVSQEKQLLERDGRTVSRDSVRRQVSSEFHNPRGVHHHSCRTEKHSPKLVHSSPGAQLAFPHATSDKNCNREKMKQRRQ